jgi:hypothetical protein
MDQPETRLRIFLLPHLHGVRGYCWFAGQGEPSGEGGLSLAAWAAHHLAYGEPPACEIELRVALAPFTWETRRIALRELAAGRAVLPGTR